MWEILTIILLAGHLLAMNVASAGPLISVWLRWRSQKPASLGTKLGRRLAWYSVVALIFGMLTGGLMLLTSPDNNLWPALRRFPASAYWFAGAELLFSLVCMIVLAVAWSSLSLWWLAALAFASATNLLYHFPPFMTVIGHLVSNAQWTSEAIIDRPILLRLIADHEVLALSFHFGVSSLAVAAMAALGLLSRESAMESPVQFQSVARAASVIALSASLLQVPIGIWLLTSLRATSRAAVMGHNIWASLAFLGALVMTIKLLQQLAMIAFGETDAKYLRQGISLACGVVLLMTMSLRLSRRDLANATHVIKAASGASAQG